MASLTELRAIRLQKLEQLRQQGMSPYGSAARRTHTITSVIDQFESLCALSARIILAGRVLTIRGQGAILFVQLWDGTDGMQVVLQRDHMGQELFQLFVDTVDVGDFVECEGELFTTNRGQDSLRASTWNILTKSLLPLPDKWHGLADEDERYRKRYLELISDSTVYDRFKVRSLVVRYIRNFFDSMGFVEVETPILQSQAGGAMARTFDTFHEDLEIPMVLRISLELEHKMLMAGGFPALYEIGKNFRNEGSDPTHIQEFTMIEWYWAYHTLEDNMHLTEKLLKGIMEDVMDGKTDFVVYDKNGDAVHVSCAGQWPRVRFDDLLRQYAHLDIATATQEQIRNCAIEWGMAAQEANTTGRGNLLDYIFKKTARHRIINPTFVTHYPGDLKPLAQQHADGTAAVAQLVIAGSEITNQYAELIDPLVQRRLLEEQSAAKAGGDEEAMQLDERFLTAMEHGMPPMTGFGMGIDRLIAILTEQRNLRETIFFPIMRPEGNQSHTQPKKSMRIAVVVINGDAQMEPWQIMNTVAHVTAGYIARTNEQLFLEDSIQSSEGDSIRLNVSHAIMIKVARGGAMMRKLIIDAHKAGLVVSEFTREMQLTTNDKKVREITAAKKLSEIEFLGVGIFGDKAIVDALTGELELYS